MAFAIATTGMMSFVARFANCAGRKRAEQNSVKELHNATEEATSETDRRPGNGFALIETAPRTEIGSRCRREAVEKGTEEKEKVNIRPSPG